MAGITNEFKIDFTENKRSPEEIRGTAQFAEYYHVGMVSIAHSNPGIMI